MGETLGTYRVGASFNPSQCPQVREAKQLAAELIDAADEVRKNTTNPEAARCAAIAMTEIESAAMWLVKAITKEDRA